MFIDTSSIVRALLLGTSVALLGCDDSSSGSALPSRSANSIEEIPVGNDDLDLGLRVGDEDPTDSDLPDDELGGGGGSGSGNEGGGDDDGGLGGGNGDDDAPVPEPGTMLILGGGVAALAASRRRRKQTS